MSKKKNPEFRTTSMTSPTTVVEPWVIEQLSKRPEESWVRDQLQGFYSKELLDLKLESLRSEMNVRLMALEADADDTQRVVIEQRGKWSKAPKRHEVDDLKTAVTGWSAWFRRIIVGVIIFLVGTGGMVVWKYAELNVMMHESEKSMNKMVDENEELQNKIVQMEKQFDMLNDFLRSDPAIFKGRLKPAAGNE